MFSFTCQVGKTLEIDSTTSPQDEQRNIGTLKSHQTWQEHEEPFSKKGLKHHLPAPVSHTLVTWLAKLDSGGLYGNGNVEDGVSALLCLAYYSCSLLELTPDFKKDRNSDRGHNAFTEVPNCAWFVFS